MYFYISILDVIYLDIVHYTISDIYNFPKLDDSCCKQPYSENSAKWAVSCCRNSPLRLSTIDPNLRTSFCH